MTEHHRLPCTDRLRCACGWSAPWPAADRWGEIWDAHIKAAERAMTAMTIPEHRWYGDKTPAGRALCKSALPQGAPAGAVTMGSPVVPPAPAASPRHEQVPMDGYPACCCGWRGEYRYSTLFFARTDWLEHAVAAYQQEEAAACDDDEADCDALAGDEVAGSEVRE